jgi:hypothetical protein
MCQLKKYKKLKKREHYSQHSGDAEVHTSQDKKRETMLSIIHKVKMHFKLYKANKEETKPAVVYDCNLDIEAVCLKLVATAIFV